MALIHGGNGIFAWLKSAIIHSKEGFAMTTIRAVIHDRRIDVPAPNELPDGTEVVLTIGKPVGVDLYDYARQVVRCSRSLANACAAGFRPICCFYRNHHGDDRL